MTLCYLRVAGITSPTYVTPKNGFTRTLDNAKIFRNEDDFEQIQLITHANMQVHPPIYVRVINL